MLEERTLHLINADIDDELTADERADLDVILESSSEARMLFPSSGRCFGCFSAEICARSSRVASVRDRAWVLSSTAGTCAGSEQ